jgi:hypothetical protein
MKAKFILPVVAMIFASAVVGSAQNSQMGTWKLNEAKSKIAKAGPKNHTVIYETSGDMIKATVDGTDSSGNPTHNEWTGKFDGKYYAETGNPAADLRSYRRVNSRTLSMREKKGNKIVTTATITVAANGKSRTVTIDGTNAEGKRFHNVAVYDKQ